jgi:hypothetical protein
MKPGLLSCWLLLFATQAFGHRLDECLQATRIAVAIDRIDLSIDLTPGVAVAGELLLGIDKDRDGRVSDEERDIYARHVLRDLQVGLDGKALTLTLTNAAFPALREVRAGLGVIRIRATASIAPLKPGVHTLSHTNLHLPGISVYLVNALVPKDRALRLMKQTRDESQRDYRLEFSVSPPTP